MTGRLNGGCDVMPLEQALRDLACWYEWGSVPSYHIVAEVLQVAADAVRVHAMSPEAADVLIQAWDYFVGREAAVDNPPPTYNQTERLGVIRYTVDDLTTMVEAADDEHKPRLAKLLREQLSILDRHKRETRWPT